MKILEAALLENLTAAILTLKIQKAALDTENSSRKPPKTSNFRWIFKASNEIQQKPVRDEGIVKNFWKYFQIF